MYPYSTPVLSYPSRGVFGIFVRWTLAALADTYQWYRGRLLVVPRSGRGSRTKARSMANSARFGSPCQDRSLRPCSQIQRYLGVCNTALRIFSVSAMHGVLDQVMLAAVCKAHWRSETAFSYMFSEMYCPPNLKVWCQNITIELDGGNIALKRWRWFKSSIKDETNPSLLH